MNEQFSDNDGMNLGGADGLIKEILDAGTDFTQQIARSGMSFEDLMDYASLWRTGITFRLPVLVTHAQQAIVASIGADRLARGEAIEAIIGHRQRQAQIEQKKRKFLNFGNRGKTESPQDVDQQLQ